MAESSGALILACLAVVCIDKCIFWMRHSFQYIMVNVLSMSVVSLSYTRSNTSVIVLFSLWLNFVLTKIFQDIINFGVKFIDFCVCMLFFCFSLPARKISLSFRKLEKNLFLAFESQFNIRMRSLRTCKTSFCTAIYKELPLCII